MSIFRMQSAPPSEAEIAAKAQELKKSGANHPAYVVAFSGIDDENKHVLTQVRASSYQMRCLPQETVHSMRRGRVSRSCKAYESIDALRFLGRNR